MYVYVSYVLYASVYVSCMYVYVSCMRPLYMRPRAAAYVSSYLLKLYMCPVCMCVCVLYVSAVYVSSYLVLLCMCPHTAAYIASAYCYTYSVLTLLYNCPHTAACVLILLYKCPHTAVYVFSYCCIYRVLILPYMSLYCYISVLILQVQYESLKHASVMDPPPYIAV